MTDRPNAVRYAGYGSRAGAGGRRAGVLGTLPRRPERRRGRRPTSYPILGEVSLREEVTALGQTWMLRLHAREQGATR